MSLIVLMIVGTTLALFQFFKHKYINNIYSISSFKDIKNG